MIEVRPLFYMLVLVSLSSLVACLPQREKQFTPALSETAKVAATTRQAGQLLSESREETPSENEGVYPRSTAVLWSDEFLWTANESGLLTRWDVQNQDYAQYRLPGEPTIRALASDGRMIYAGTEGGDIWGLTGAGIQSQLVDSEFGRISALALDGDQNLWYADIDLFGRADLRYQSAQGLVFLELDRSDQYTYGTQKRVYSHLGGQHPELNPLQEITSLAFDPQRSILWVGTRFAGLLGYDTRQDSWQAYKPFTTDVDHNTINDLKVAPDGSLWLATASGVSSYRNGVWDTHPLINEPMTEGALSLAIAGPVADVISLRAIWYSSAAIIFVLTGLAFFSRDLMNIEKQKTAETPAV